MKNKMRGKSKSTARGMSYGTKKSAKRKPMKGGKKMGY